MQKVRSLLVIVVVFVSTFLSFHKLQAHSGRTDANGGHYNRKTGEYHYHNSGTRNYTPPPRSVPRQSTSQNIETEVSSYKPTPIKLPKPTPFNDSYSKKPTGITLERIIIYESHWQEAFNKVLNGRMDVSVSEGTVDILSNSFTVEVEKASNYAEGIEQALKFARSTGKQPVLALYIDGEKNGYHLLKQAEELCESKGVTLVLINEHVSVVDLIAVVLDNKVVTTSSESLQPANLTSTPVPTTTPTHSPISAQSTLQPESAAREKANNTESYWLNTSSNVRHNSSCRYYRNTKNGRMCSQNEGRACGTCGG